MLLNGKIHWTGGRYPWLLVFWGLSALFWYIFQTEIMEYSLLAWFISLLLVWLLWIGILVYAVMVLFDTSSEEKQTLPFIRVYIVIACGVAVWIYWDRLASTVRFFALKPHYRRLAREISKSA